MSYDLGAPLGASGTTPKEESPVMVPSPHIAESTAEQHETLAASMASTSTAPTGVDPTHPSVDSSAEVHGSTDTSAGPPSSAPVASQTSQPHPTNDAPATATIDPNVPSSESAPTALPTNPGTHPEEQKEAIKDEHPAVVAREVEKTRAAERELKGEAPKGTVVAGMEDDRLWAMLRRFDVQITHVLHPATHLPPNEPDLRQTTLPDVPSHSDVLKSNLERCFAALGPSSLRGMREMERLMSWSEQERWRTGIFCVSYFICWIFGYAVAGVLSFFVAIVCFPECRRWFFPPVAPEPFTPVSATDPTNKRGDESLLGNVDSKTVHRSKAEQAEEQAFEATSILQAYTTRLLFDGRKKGKEAGNSNVGEKSRRKESSSDDDDDDEDLAKKPQGEAAQGLESADVVVGGEKITSTKPISDKEKKKLAQKEAKRKRDELVAKMTKATEVGLGSFADTMERFTNALSPPVPYPDSYARFKIAGAFLVPPMFLLTFTPAWIFGRAATFAFGVGMWGQPLLIRAAKKFVELVPDWQDKLDMRNSILSRVPTDQQLTLHLLRVAEALGTPLPRPPPPPLAGTPKEAIKDTTPATVTQEDDAEVQEAEEEGGVTEVATKAKVKTKGHIMGMFQKAGKKMAAFNGDVSIDGTKHTDLKEKIGTKVDRFVYRGHTKDDGSVTSYPAKYNGSPGRIILEPRSDTVVYPQISFVPTVGAKAEFVLPIDDIVEIKKAHVSMTRMALGWASGAEVEGLGLTIRFKSVDAQIAEAHGAPKTEGETKQFTKVERREGLFVRLVSMGRQRWETL